MANGPRVDFLLQLLDVSHCLGFYEHLVCWVIEEVFWPQLDIIFDVNSNRAQFLVCLRYDDGLILLDGGQEELLVGVRFCFPCCMVIALHTVIRKEFTWTSIVLGGSGGRQHDFALSLEGTLPSSHPTKNVLRPMSCSMQARDSSTLEWEGEWWGVGMNLRLSPRREVAAGGSDFHFVRSWNAVLAAFRR